MVAQLNVINELIVDNFAGGGGASTGIELATGRPVDIAINHDPDAILMHKTNHPYTRHYCESVWDIDPVKVCAGRPVGLAWFSPDCKHFSKAKGGKPVNKNIRGLSWVILRWMLAVRPRVIMMENVEEIMTWGPLIQKPDGTLYPDADKQGETFKGFILMMSTGIDPSHPALIEACDSLKISTCSGEAQRLIDGLGYAVDYKILKAADYGTPTIRKRFFLVARCDGKLIVWPEPTHNRDGSGGKKKWRSASEIIDWTLPCPSIFDTAGEIWAKHGLRAQRPLAEATMCRIARGIQKFVVDNPDPFIVQVNHGGGFRGQSIEDPVQTVTAKNGYGVITPVITSIGQTGFSSDRSRSVYDPINTTVSKAEQCLITPYLTLNNANNVPSGADEPVRTITTGNRNLLTMPALIQYHTEKESDYVRGQTVTNPVMTIDANNRYAITEAFLTEYYGSAQDGICADEPLHTITARDREGVTLAHLSKFYGGIIGSSADEPLSTVTAIDHNAITATFVSKFYKTGVGQPAEEPLHTVTQSVGHFGEVRASLIKCDGRQELYHWHKVRLLLNEYCGYSIADDEILVLEIAGAQWFIRDIGLRMLIPKELYAANGFPLDYIIDRDYKGKKYSKTKQVARCGNAVPPQLATALVRANLPEWCGLEITTMRQFHETVSA